MELISVIVPVYNVEKYLRRCIESICRQTYHKLEIILVDDGSIDASGEVCDFLEKEDARIKVIHKKNGGLGYARNSGLDVATGEYVTFIDSDDWISDSHIMNLYNDIKAANADLCIGGHTNVKQSGEENIVGVKLDKGIYLNDDIIQKILLPLIGTEENYANDIQLESSCCMNLYKMEPIKKHNLNFLNEKYAVAEDLYFNVDFLNKIESVVVSEEKGYFYYENPVSISRKYDSKRFERTVNFYSEIMERVNNYKLSDITGFRVHRSYIVKIRVAIKHIVMSELNYKNKIEEIDKILSNPLTEKILNEYPIETYIFALRVSAILMKEKKSRLLYWIIRGRENAKKSYVLAGFLRILGVGK